MRKYKQVQIDVDVSRAIEGQRLSFSESENDILRRMILKSPARPEKIVASGSGSERSRGNWEVNYQGKTTVASNLKGAYRLLLLQIANDQPEFLSEFSKERSRSRGFVSKNPASLYDNSPQLAKDHALPLTGGWYFDSNLSRSQVGQRARVAAKIARQDYGPAFNISESGVPI
jgi:hypothetical protein